MTEVATPRKLAILLFDDVEVLDFCGPFEVFSVASNQSPHPSFNVFTVAEKSPMTARNGLSVNPAFSLETCPKPDILLVPAGIGTRKEMNNDALIHWIKHTADAAELVLFSLHQSITSWQSRLAGWTRFDNSPRCL